MKSPIENIAQLIVILLVSVALAGCGNKGPLVRPSAIPAKPVAAPVPVQPVEKPATEPAATPAAEPASDTPATPR